MIDAYQLFMCVVPENCLVIAQHKNYLLIFLFFIETLLYKQKNLKI
jgi:hypothetical protein